MAEIRLTKAKIRNVPIAVTPEGFWCCPSPVGFQKNQKPQNLLNRPKSSPLQTRDNPIPTKQNSITERKPGTPSSSRMGPVNDEQRAQTSDSQVLNNPPAVNEKVTRPKVESVSRKVAIEFGEARTSDLKVIVLGKQGIAVKLSVHKSVLVKNSVFFSKKILEQQLVFPCLEIEDCEDVEIYVETIGLMYCNELKQRLMRQSVSRVLRIIKVAEQLGFAKCVHSCLEYLEAAPWVGEEEQEQVVSSILHLETEGILVKPVLKRVCSNIPKPPKDTLTHILELVLKSNEERARREMKSVVLKLLKENNSLPSSSGSSDLGNETIYCSCRRSLDSLLCLFRRAAEPDLIDEQVVVKSMALEADNLLWLLDILADRQAADEFAIIWSNQQELASLHTKLPLVSRHHVSKITVRLFVGIGKGELLPSKDTRHLLLQTWLQPLMNDYSWLQHACRSFDRKVVEEGIGRTILTLPLEDQQSILLSWLGSFLKAGDSCPNLQRAFEVWWRRTFVRPYVEPEILHQSDSAITSNLEEC